MAPRIMARVRSLWNGLRRDALRFSWLDFKLGFRMLARYPGLTVVGGLAMAFAIAIGAGAFEAVLPVVRPRLFPEGDRIVAISNWDMAANRVQRSVAQDLGTWREQLESVRDVGAYHRWHSSASALPLASACPWHTSEAKYNKVWRAASVSRRSSSSPRLHGRHVGRVYAGLRGAHPPSTHHPADRSVEIRNQVHRRFWC